MVWMTPARRAYTPWIILALVIIAGILWLRYAPPTAPWSPHQVIGMVMPEPRTITKVEKVTVPGPVRIKVVPKEVIVTKYRDLPTPATVSDPAAVVTAVATIPPSPDGGVALAVLKPGVDNVGVGSIEYRPNAPRFIQVKRSFGAEGWYYPVGDRQAEASLVANPLQIGPVEIKAKVGAAIMRENSQIRGFVAIGGEIRF